MNPDLLRFIRKKYEGKTVFITGCSGFKGSWLCFLLNKIGARVVGIADRIEDYHHNFDALKLTEGIKFHLCDVRNHCLLQKILLSEKPDYIFHLAAKAFVGECESNPKLAYEVNVMGTVNLFECLREYGKECNICVVTSDKVYGNDGRRVGYIETDPLAPTDFYGNSKACADIIAKCYRNQSSGSKSIITVRAGNVIGGGDWSPGRLVPDLVTSLAQSAPLVLRNPDYIRPWQHVYDVIFQYVLLTCMECQQMEQSTEFNIAPHPDNQISVESFVSQFLAIWGQGDPEVKILPGAIKEHPILFLDGRKAHKIMGLQHTNSLHKSLADTVEFYRASIEEIDLLPLAHHQIDRYFNQDEH